jgi:hypothetical protein
MFPPGGGFGKARVEAFEGEDCLRISNSPATRVNRSGKPDLPVLGAAFMRTRFYKATALQATVPFRIQVAIGSTTYLPLEMAGDTSRLGQPGQQTRLNLTLGEDTNGNGLPDAWERAMIAARGWNLTLANLRTNSTPAGNGATLMQEYIAGTYGMEDDNGLNVKIVRIEAGKPVLEFMAVRGRNYSIVGSANFKAWLPVRFQAPILDPATGETANRTIDSIQSTAVQLMQVTVVAEPGTPLPLFYKLRIQ